MNECENVTFSWEDHTAWDVLAKSIALDGLASPVNLTSQIREVAKNERKGRKTNHKRKKKTNKQTNIHTKH
jgi:hypothetical protein